MESLADALTEPPGVAYIPRDTHRTLPSRCRVPPVSEPTSQSLTAEQIEALLRAARDRQSGIRSDVVSNEPLGPGDVQHLRNTSFAEAAFAEAGWPVDMLPADELLRQAEQQLAEALSTRDGFLDATPAVAGVRGQKSGVRSQESGVRGQESLTPAVAQPFPFAPFDLGPATTTATGSASGLSLESLGDIELDVTLELGRAEITIEELLQLREGSVVPLDKAAGDPIDILANGRLVARGEVIVVDDKFGVRICEVVSQR